MIIFDELQHFVDRSGERKSLEVTDWLKTVIEQSNTSVVLMGLERCEHLFRINEQLRRRFSKRIDIRPFSIDTQESYIEFVGVVVAILEKLKIIERVNLNNKELISAIYFATNGIIGYLIKLLIGVYEKFIELNCQNLDSHIFEMAFTENIWIEGRGKLNPFHRSFIWERLDKEGMPFHRFNGGPVSRMTV